MRRILDRFFFSVGKKIAVTVVAMLFIGGGTFAFFAWNTGRAVLEDRKLSKAHGISTLLKNSLERLMLDNHTTGREKLEFLRPSLETVTRSPDVVGAYIIDTAGSVILDAVGSSTKLPVSLEQFREYPGVADNKFASSEEGGTHVEYVLSAIERKPECSRCHGEQAPVLGYFVLKVSTDEIWEVARKHRNMNIVLTVLIFTGLSIIIVWLLNILVIKPIGHLHGNVRHIAGDLYRLKSGEKIGFPMLPDPSYKDEIADLSRDFNNLVRNLNEANAKLFEVHQSQLEHADRLASTGEMAASIAHEIKNPLAGILGAVQVFDGEVADDDPKKEILSEMKIQLERMNHAVNDLLSYARPTQPVFEPVHLHDLIKKIITLLPHQFKEKNIVMKEELFPNPILIHADKKQLQQVLWNIVLNGMQAMDHGGVLTISTSTTKGKVTITVKDTGKGIPPDQLERVFKPFYTTKHKGTGLGMTISRRIIEQHHGSIQVRSTLGVGTTIEILLPSASEQ